MLQRIFLLTLLLVSVLAQDAAPDSKDSQSQPDGETVSLEDRPRGERADDELPPPRRQRPRPGSGSGFGSFLSGFLGSVTKTASAEGCPGKCIHAIASLMCDEVIQEIECPASNMRCCVEKSSPAARPKPPPRENVGLLDALDLGLEMPPRPKEAEEKVDNNADEEEEDEEEITDDKPEKKRRKKKRKTTTEAPTTTTRKTTTKASKKTTTTEKPDQKKDDDSSSSSLSRFSNNITLSLAIASLLTFLQTSKHI